MATKQQYFVEDVIGYRIEKGERQWLVEWDGYPLDEASWEPKKNVEHLDVWRSFEITRRHEKQLKEKREKKEAKQRKKREQKTKKTTDADVDNNNNDSDDSDFNSSKDRNLTADQVPLPNQKKRRRRSLKSMKASFLNESDHEGDSQPNSMINDDQCQQTTAKSAALPTPDKQQAKPVVTKFMLKLKRSLTPRKPTQQQQPNNGTNSIRGEET